MYQIHLQIMVSPFFYFYSLVSRMYTVILIIHTVSTAALPVWYMYVWWKRMVYTDRGNLDMYQSTRKSKPVGHGDHCHPSC